MESESEIREQTTDLSAFGCQVSAQKPLAAGTKVRLRIIHHGAIFTAQGRVANVRRNSMGVVFTKTEQKDQVVLEKWLGEAPETPERTSSRRGTFRTSPSDWDIGEEPREWTRTS